MRSYHHFVSASPSGPVKLFLGPSIILLHHHELGRGYSYGVLLLPNCEVCLHHKSPQSQSEVGYLCGQRFFQGVSRYGPEATRAGLQGSIMYLLMMVMPYCDLK